MKKEYRPEIKIQDGVHLVSSERVAGRFYEIRLRNTYDTCTCIAYEMRGRDCKHIAAARQWETDQLPFTPMSQAELEVL